MTDDLYDAIVIGGGPAGLAGAFWIARYQHTVRLFDAQSPRNRWTGAIHGYLGAPEIAPNELRRVGREQAVSVGAELEAGSVVSVHGEIDAFQVTLNDAREYRARRILFASGLTDVRPEIPGFDEFYGRSIWHCPDCDGPSARGCAVGMIGSGKKIAASCVLMTRWADSITLFTNGRDPELDDQACEVLGRIGVKVYTEPIRQIEGKDGKVELVCLAGGDAIRADALFFHVSSGPTAPFAAELGCETDEAGLVSVDRGMQTTIPGVYAAGDIIAGTRLAIRAAAEGTRAAIAIARSLIPDELKL